MCGHGGLLPSGWKQRDVRLQRSLLLANARPVAIAAFPSGSSLAYSYGGLSFRPWRNMWPWQPCLPAVQQVATSASPLDSNAMCVHGSLTFWWWCILLATAWCNMHLWWPLAFQRRRDKRSQQPLLLAVACHEVTATLPSDRTVTCSHGGFLSSSGGTRYSHLR